MASFKNFEELLAWQKARMLCNTVYRVTSETGFNRDFCLRDQIRRAAVSVMSNIAEGFERQTDREFSQFLFIAKGSASEVRSQLYIALDQKYITTAEFDEISSLANEIIKLISGLITYLKPKPDTLLKLNRDN